MSLLLKYSLTDAASLMRGDLCGDDRSEGFPLGGLSAWRFSGLEAIPGHTPIDSDVAWESVVRSWWGLGATWGLCVSGEGDEISWNLLLPTWDLILPGSGPTMLEPVKAHLTGAQLEPGTDFPRFIDRLKKFPSQVAMAGHSGVGETARLEPAVRAMAGQDFMILVMAEAVTRPEIEAEMQRLGEEEQFVCDEHLSTPGLEKDNHAGAARYLSLVEAAQERAVTSLQEGAWKVRTLVATDTAENLQRVQSLMHSAFAGDGGEPEPLRWQQPSDPRKLTFLRTGEVAALSRPARRDLPGFVVEAEIHRTGTDDAEISTSSTIFATSVGKLSENSGIPIGMVLDDSGRPGSWLEIAINDLRRHVLVAGMTGSGKTTTCEHLLLELWREYRIPWLVIEPGMKTSYRRLLNSEIGEDLNVWAVGTPRVQRLPMNPLSAPVGIGLAEHISGLFSVIASAFELVAPMPEVLATAIDQTYRHHGWDLAGLVPEGAPPLLSDLLREIDSTTRGLGYDAVIAGNIRAGLLLRLKRLSEGPLSPELTSQKGLDLDMIVSRPTVIELSSLPDSDTQSVVMGFIALQLRHHWRLAGPSDSLRHVTLIEEAHRLLRNVPETDSNAARTRAVEDLANMLAELRGMGAGLVIVDQTPSALVPSVIANTGTKILHRLDHPDDRELAGRSAGLPQTEVDLLGKLRIGDAVFRSDRRPRPFRLRFPNPAVTYGKLSLPPLPCCDQDPEAEPNDCPICDSPFCQGEQLGSNPDLLKSRLEKLQTILGAGDEQKVWEWADIEMQQHMKKGTDPSPTASLCFLFALGRAANLPVSILNSLRSSFVSNAQEVD